MINKMIKRAHAALIILNPAGIGREQRRKPMVCLHMWSDTVR